MKQTNKFLHKVLAAVLTIAALMTGQSAWATEKTVTYTFKAEKVDGQPEAMKLTFTPSGNQFGTNPGCSSHRSPWSHPFMTIYRCFPTVAYNL